MSSVIEKRVIGQPPMSREDYIEKNTNYDDDCGRCGTCAYEWDRGLRMYQEYLQTFKIGTVEFDPGMAHPITSAIVRAFNFHTLNGKSGPFIVGIERDKLEEFAEEMEASCFHDLYDIKAAIRLTALLRPEHFKILASKALEERLRTSNVLMRFDGKLLKVKYAPTFRVTNAAYEYVDFRFSYPHP